MARVAEGPGRARVHADRSRRDHFRAAALPAGSDERDDLLDALRRGAHLRERARTTAAAAGAGAAALTQAERDVAWSKSKLRMHSEQLDTLRRQEQQARERLADAAPEDRPQRERDLTWATEALRLQSVLNQHLRTELRDAQALAAAAGPEQPAAGTQRPGPTVESDGRDR